MAQTTITYSDKSKGWTSFHSYNPEWIVSLNNRLFTFKKGQLWLHNDEENPVRNNFYWRQFTSKITPVFNDMNSEDKIFKTIDIESNKAWSAALSTNYSEGQIYANEFNQRESRFFAYIRKNESATDLHGNTAQGIGSITAVAGAVITFQVLPSYVNIGDQLIQMNGATQLVIGTITGFIGNAVVVGSTATTPVVGRFCFCKRNPRVEGAEMRGNYLEVTFENTDTDDVKLFGVGTNAVKSFV